MDRRIGGFRAFGLGIRALRRNGSLWAFAVGAEALLAACRQVLLVAGFLALLRELVRGLNGAAHASLGKVAMPLFGSWFALAAIAAVVRLVYLGAAVVDASAALREPERNPEPVIASGARVFVRAVIASFWLWLIELAGELCRAVLVGSALLVFLSHAPGGSALGAAPIAMGITLALLVALLISLFGRVYLVQALRHLELGALPAAWEAGRSLGGRLGTYLLITFIAVALTVAGGMVSGTVGAMAGGTHFVVGRVLVVIAAALAAGWHAAVELASIGALCAVDLDQRGELPRPPQPPEPVHEAHAVEPAEQVLVAQVVEPEPTS